MKIKITYSDNELEKACELEKIIRMYFVNEQYLNIKKPEKKQPFNHTYMTVGKK